MLDVVALGELLIDFTCVETDKEGYPTMAAHPGGAPANVLAALSKFGAKAALLGKVGNDTFGKLLTGTLRKAGICTELFIHLCYFTRCHIVFAEHHNAANARLLLKGLRDSLGLFKSDTGNIREILGVVFYYIKGFRAKAVYELKRRNGTYALYRS